MTPRTLAALGAAAVLALTLSSCNALRAELRAKSDTAASPTGPTLEEIVTTAMPGVVDVGTTGHRDGFSQVLRIFVTWPAEPALDATTLRAGAAAVCADAPPYDRVWLQIDDESDAPLDLAPLWADAFPDASQEPGGSLLLTESGCANLGL
ncbi:MULTISPECIES: hypothetical protein [unclassified Cellulomonas]|uniref:hypothetical protein n=1 Tax=unclassified Cellulomonas TaxID=2620175 RepID=UPI000626C374|nr:MULTISPECIES: hypothetical protein [unclassified Cellulomonas]TFH70698.1 hypothetical protein E4A51_13185 [Cellulomonas sp. HD19AZ1]